MAYYAQINDKGEVINVIVADEDFIKSGAVGDQKYWIETCMEGSFRGCYAGIGHIYDHGSQKFISLHELRMRGFK